MPSVFSFASGTSFHRQIFPDATLSLGFSATAMHWLSRLPALIAEQVHAVGASRRGAGGVRRAGGGGLGDASCCIARANWCRAGKWCSPISARTRQGRYLGATGGRNMHAQFGAHWRALHAAGAIAEGRSAHARRFRNSTGRLRNSARPSTIPTARSAAPGCALEECFTVLTPCPYAARFTRPGEWSPAEFARAYVPTLRSWSESMFFGALDPSRDEAARREIVDRFYAAYEAEVAAAPEGHAMDYVHCFMRVRKEG